MPTTWSTELVARAQSAAPFHARYANAALKLPVKTPEGQDNPGVTFGLRLIEEFGLRDIWDEFARLDDEGMSVTHVLSTLGGLGSQMANAPLQAVIAVPQELNRLAGAAALAVPGTLGLGAEGAGNPWLNYLSGGITTQEQLDISARSAPGIYKPLKFSDLRVVAFDRMIRKGMPPLIANLIIPGVTRGEGDAGPLPHGAYLPDAWDLTAADAGDQLDRSGIYQSQRMASQLVTEITFDPLNYAAGAINGLRKAWQGYTLVGDTATVQRWAGPASTRENLIGSGADLTGLTEIGKINRRLMHRPAGAGLVNQGGMLQMLQDSHAPLVRSLVRETDPDKISGFLYRNGMVADQDTARQWGLILARLDNETDVLHAFNAGGYRNVVSVRALDARLADTESLRNNFRTALNLTDDIFERAALDFVGTGGPLPKGHILSDNAKQFVDEVLGDDESLRAAWEALDDPVREGLEAQVRQQQLSMHAMERLFGPQAPAAAGGERVVADALQGLGSINFIPRNPLAFEPTWWSLNKPRVLRAEGTRFSRYRPQILLMNKPGLHFSLHGDDAVDKFNDLIRWTDARLSSQKYLGTFAAGYRFANDPAVLEIRNRFIDAGVVADAPEQLRADAVNDLQTLVLTRMAEATGFEPEVAQVIAQRGMQKGDDLARALNDTDRGYVTPVVEDGRSMILANQASVEKQAANFVPLMDWDGVFKALYAVRRGEHAYLNGESELISIGSTVGQKYFGAGSKYAERPLKYVGREESALRRASHDLIDVADVVAYAFKTSVLLRLGYTARNLAEGSMSAMASGMSALEIMRYSDYGGLIGNTLYNLTHIPDRMIDRLMVGTGFRMSDTAALHYADALAEVDNITQDRLHSFYAVVGDGRLQGRLEKIIVNADSKYTPEEVLAAENGLRWLIEQKQRLALGITIDNASGHYAGVARPIQGTHAAQHLYHADTSGSLATRNGFDTEGVLALDQDLDAPIRTVEDPVLAHGHVNQQWPILPTAGRDVNDRAAALQAHVRSLGGGTLFRYTDHSGQARQTTKAKTVLQRADPAQPITVHRVRKPTPTRPGAVYAGRTITLPPPTIFTAVKGMRTTHHLQMRANANSLWEPYNARRVTSSTEVRALERATHPDFPKVVAVDTWGRELDLRGAADQAAAVRRYRDIDANLVTNAALGDRAAQDSLSSIMAGHGIYRIVLPDDVKAGWGRHQVLIHPKGVGERGFRDAVQQEYDGIVWAAARASGPEVGMMVDAAGKTRRIGGSRGRIARERKHPARRTTAQRHELVGEPLDPNTSLRAIDILRNGGFEAYGDELVEAAIRTRRNRYSAQALYLQRKARMDALAKRKGISRTANIFRMKGAYGYQYQQPSLQEGSDGNMFKILTSGQATHLMGYAQISYLTEVLDDLVRSQLVPTTVTPNDPRYFDAMANLFGRQYRDQAGFQAGALGDGGVDNLDPVVRRLLAPGDRERLVEETTDWALHTPEGRQWVRTLGLRVMPPRSVGAELEEAGRAAAARMPEQRATTRAQRREPIHADWQREGDIAISEVSVGDAVATMSNFLEHHVLPSPQATRMLLEGNVTGEALRAAHEAEPWALHPLSGLLSPTTAETRDRLAVMRANMGKMERLNHWLVGKMSVALKNLGAVPEARLLRHPMFEAIGQADLRQRISYAENVLGRSVSLEERNQLAAKSQRFALKKVEQTLYTLQGRTSMDDYLRFVAPFFPAWRNALTRWGRIVTTAPGSTAQLSNRVQMMGQQLTLVNEAGEEVEFNEASARDTFVIMPGLGGLAEAVTGIEGARESMRNTRLRLSSMDVMFQGDMLSPGFGPFVAAPLQFFLTGHSEWLENDVIKWVAQKVLPVGPVDTGKASLDYLSLFMPTALRNAVTWAAKPQSWADEAARNTMLIATLERNGEMEPSANYNELRRKAERLTELKMGIKVLSALASPIASQQRGDLEFYASVWRSLRDAYGSTAMADEQFNRLFPAQYLLTASGSQNLTGGAATSRAARNQREQGALQEWAAMNGTQHLLGWSENYDDDAFLHGHASAGFTQDDYNPYARRWQRLNQPKGADPEERFRSGMSPEQVQHRMIVKEGYRLHDQTKAAVERELVQQGLAPGSWEYQKALDEQMLIADDYLAARMPIWAREREERDEGTLMENEAHFKDLINRPELGFITEERNQHALIKSMRRFFDVRDSIRLLLYSERMRNPKASLSTEAQSNSHLAALLAMERTKLANQSPAFREWADRYFRHDFVSIDHAYIPPEVR